MFYQQYIKKVKDLTNESRTLLELGLFPELLPHLKEFCSQASF